MNRPDRRSLKTVAPTHYGGVQADQCCAYAVGVAVVMQVYLQR